MSRNGTGTYNVPNTFSAGTSITAAGHNENWSDIGSEITNSVAADGQTTMTGPLKAANGTAAAPSMAFGADQDTGFFRKGANQIGISIAGIEIGYLDSTGLNVNGISGNGAVPSSTVVFTLRSTAPSAWLMFNDGTLGDANSGADYSNVLAQAVFTDLFNNISDANCPILTSVGGATTRVVQTDAATAWAAHCRLSLPKALGRVLASAGAGSGLTSRALGAIAGAETVTLAQTDLPNVTLAYSGTALATTANVVAGGNPTGTAAVGGTQGGVLIGGSAVNQLASNFSGATASMNGNNTQTAINKVPQSVFLNTMIKL